jgi:ADP-heptose:LPS heptosyltransferase
MKPFTEILDKISYANTALKKENAKRILLLYEEKVLFIGDTCIKFGMFELFKSFFPNAHIDLNWKNSKFSEAYEALLQDNPIVNKMTNLDWSNLDFSCYDLVLIISFEEENFLSMLERKYHSLMAGFPWNTAFFSLSRIGLNLTTRKAEVCFPEYTELINFAVQYPHQPQLFISEVERQWGKEWLEAHRIDQEDKLFILIDSASSTDKLVNTKTFCELITFLSGIEKSKILIYDENLSGKEKFYAERIPRQTLSKMIFAKGLGLRRDLRLVASPYTKLVFGPCTGLLHCASGIYNQFVKDGMLRHTVPPLITYTGTYEGDWNNAHLWWGTSPLVQCLMLKNINDNKKVVLLHELNEKEKTNKENLLPCQEYTAPLLINHLKGYI